jgi:hypothetical protein
MVNLMKKTTLPKNKRMDSRKRQSLDVGKAAKILRSVKDEEAFRFYEALGKPTGETATSLSDFLEKVKSVKSESLVFHLQRGDFQNWTRKTLGDSKLAQELGMISPLEGGDIRASIRETVGNRIKELTESCMTVQVDDSSTGVLAAFPRVQRNPCS